jgi:hypothetical protein
MVALVVVVVVVVVAVAVFEGECQREIYIGSNYKLEYDLRNRDCK